MVKITTLIENTPDRDRKLHAEHGLSLWIEDGKQKILFDTGQSGKFIENAKRLGVDLESADKMVLSHAHYDHGGGMRAYWQAFSQRPELWLGRCFFSQGKKFHMSDGSVKTDFAKEPGRRYIGVDFTEQDILEQGMKVRYVSEPMQQVSESIYVFGNFERRYAFETLNPTMELKTAAGFIVDSFADEIALGVITANGVVVLLGCAHPGFLNMASAISERTGKKLAGIIGGTHLVEADAARTALSVATVREMGISVLGLSHCTGSAAVAAFQEAFPGSFVNRTGAVLQL